jgi:hypothetical protein
MNNVAERIKNAEAELIQLREIQELNEKVFETRGRKQKLSEPLTESICFKVTKSQLKKLDIVKEAGIILSDYIRQAIFGKNGNELLEIGE